jgi:hypothetical protein
MDFNDSLTVTPDVGNLDQILGPALYYPIEAIYVIVPLMIFLLFGWAAYVEGKGERNSREKFYSKIYIALIAFLTYLILLSLDDLDDISKVLQLHIHFTLTYWYVMQALYPTGSILIFISFGVVCESLGRKSARKATRALRA